MKTPYAILIGLALIAAALFFRQPAVAPAQAGLIGDVDGFKCVASEKRKTTCAILDGNQITFALGYFDGPSSQFCTKTVKWR